MSQKNKNSECWRQQRIAPCRSPRLYMLGAFLLFVVTVLLFSAAHCAEQPSEYEYYHDERNESGNADSQPNIRHERSPVSSSRSVQCACIVCMELHLPDYDEPDRLPLLRKLVGNVYQDHPNQGDYECCCCSHLDSLLIHTD